MSEPGSEYDDLEDLLRHPGWLRLKARMETYWEKDFADRVREAVGLTEDTRALDKLRQVVVAQDAVRTALKWPEERLRQLRDQKAANDPRLNLSRRGTL